MGNLLVPFKKFLSNKNTVTILGVLLGIVILYFGYTWRVNQSLDPQSVPYAMQTLKQGQKITEEYIGYTDLPKDYVKNMNNILTNPAEINGKLVAYDSKIPKNGFFFSDNLITEDQRPDSVFSNIKDGDTIVNFKVNKESTYGNSIFPGDYIDIYMKTESEDGLLVFGCLIKGIQVLAVKDSNGQNVFADKDALGESTNMMFAVPEDLFLLLMRATYLGSIDLVLVPRNDAYSEHANATQVPFQQLVNIIRDKCLRISGQDEF